MTRMSLYHLPYRMRERGQGIYHSRTTVDDVVESGTQSQVELPVMLRKQYHTLNDMLGQKGIHVEAVSFDGKRSIGIHKEGIEKVLAHYDKFNSGRVAEKFEEEHGMRPKYDGIIVGEIGDGNALGANIVTDDGKQYLMIDKRYIERMDDRQWEQVFSHEWYHGLGLKKMKGASRHYDEYATSMANAALYESLAHESTGWLRESYQQNAREERARAQMYAQPYAEVG